MLIPIDIEYKNLFSHPHTHYKFRVDEMCLFIGVNEDSSGVDSNGAGKSSTIEAISLAFTGEVYRGLNKDHFIRTGEESCEVIFNLRNTVEKTVLTIQRIFYAGNKTSKLDIYIDGVATDLQAKNKMKRTAQEYIYDMLGFGKEDFFNFFVIGQDNENSFFSSTDGKQKEVISRFSNYTKVDAVVDKIKEELTLHEMAYDTVLNKCESKLIQRDTLKESLEELQTEVPFEDEKAIIQLDIETLKKKIADIQVKIESNELAIDDINKKTKSLYPLIKGHKESSIKDKTVAAKNLKVKQESIYYDLKEMRGELATRNGMIISCPKCKWQFIPNDDMTAKEVQESKEHVDREIVSTEVAIKECDETINKLRDIQLIFRTIADLEQQYTSLDDRLTNNKKFCADYKQQLKTKQLELKNYKPKKNDNAALIKSTQEKIDVLNNEATALARDAKTMEGTKEKLKFHLFSFQQQFRTYISNKTIRTIQDITNYYLQLFKIDVRVYISGFKVNKDGTVRDKIEIWVIKNGKDRLPFKALSGGEKARIKLCGVFALKKLINNAAETGGLDLLCLDEMLGELDSSGQQKAVEILDQAKMTCMMVMHHAENIQCKNKVITVKQNGVSSITKQ